MIYGLTPLGILGNNVFKELIMRKWELMRKINLKIHTSLKQLIDYYMRNRVDICYVNLKGWLAKLILELKGSSIEDIREE